MQSEIYRHIPLSELDMQVWERKFHNFMSPVEFKAQYDQLFRIVGTLEFFVKAGLTFMRDAYVSAKFGNIRDVEKVRLVPVYTNENQCEVLENGEIANYQVVKLVEVDPKLREAFKNGKTITFVPKTEEMMTENLYDGIARTKQALIEKSKTTTSEEAKLVIYFNVYELKGEAIFTELVSDMLKSANHGFSIVNFIRQGKVYRFGPNFDHFRVFHNQNDIF